MWVFQVKKHKITSYQKLFGIAIFYQVNPIQNITNITEITKISLNLVPHTNLQIGEKFSLIVFIANTAQSDTSHIFLLLLQIPHRH